MKNKINFLFSFVILCFFNYKITNAQTDSCIGYLKNANMNYEQREFDAAIKLLQKALLECNLDKSDKIQSHKMLALSYLGIDNLEAADKEAEEIMKLNPNYSTDKFKDDPKLSALFEKFKPMPVFRIGFFAGINRSIIDVDSTYSIVHNNDAEDLGTYNNKMGFQLGLSAEYRAYKNLWVQVEGQFRQSNYEHILNNIENTTVNYSEQLSYIDLPLSAKYYFLNKKIEPYLEAGAVFSFLSNALSTTTHDDQQDLVNRTDYRESYMTGFFGGVGAAYNLKGIAIFASFRYTYFGDNVNKEGTRFADDLNVFKYYYIDDDFRMDNWQINVGAKYSLSYKNQKVK